MGIRCAIPVLILITIVSAAAGQPLQDEGLVPVTPLPDADLVIVRERAYGAVGVDLTPYGIGSGPVDFVQSIYFRTFTADDGTNPASFAYRVQLPAGVAILGVITSGTDLGGATDDGVATESDLVFGVGSAPDDYSEDLRGFETGGSTGTSEFIGVPRPDVLTFALNVTRGVDDFRVIIDYGDSFPPNLSFDIEQIEYGNLGGAPMSDGIRVGLPGPVPGSGDHDELESLTGIPLTGSGTPTAGSTIPYNPHANLYLLRNTILGRIDGYDVFHDVPWQEQFRVDLATEVGITDGTDGLLYAVDRDGGIARMDPQTDVVDLFTAPDLPGNILGLTASPGTTDLFLMRDTSGSTFLDRMETATFTYIGQIEVPATEVSNPRGITDGPDGLLYMVSNSGRIMRVDPVAETATTAVVLSPPAGSYTGLTGIPLHSRLLYLIRDLSGDTAVDTWNVDSGAVTYGFATFAEPALPKGITDGPSHLIFAVGSVGYAAIDPLTGEVVTSHATYDFSGSNVAVTAIRSNFAVSAAPHPATRPAMLFPAVPNPFNPYTKLSFELPDHGHVRLTVHDTAGRLVAVLVDGARPAGHHAAFWDGCDGQGRRTASGVYFYRIEFEGRTEARRMVLIQ